MSDQILYKEKPEPDRRIAQAVGLFCVCMLLLICVGFPLQMASLTIGLPITLIGCILAPAAAFVALKGVSVPSGLRLRMISPLVLFGSVLVGVGGWILAVGLHYLVVQVLGQPLDAGMEINSLADYGVMILIAAILPGICEECLFRGAIQGVFERRGQWFAIVAAATLFGVFHVDPWRIPPAALLGLSFGWLTARTQSLLPAMLAHTANNATAFSVAYFLGSQPPWLAPTLVGLFVIGVILVARNSNKQTAEDSFNHNPLATVPAGVPTVIAVLGGGAIAMTSVAFGGLVYIVLSTVTVVPMSDDALEPQINKGDRLVLFRNGTFAFDPAAGDTVTFQSNDEQITRVVIRVEDDRVILRGKDDEELDVSRSDIIGELAQVVTSSTKDD